mmetsp:Transcript_50532/g.96518  ORF Transcript_50532/g.96518 Transcript_50532/m.96518 type:complete len:670 (-) Transcript_50532:944-2953(-)
MPGSGSEMRNSLAKRRRGLPKIIFWLSMVGCCLIFANKDNRVIVDSTEVSNVRKLLQTSTTPPMETSTPTAASAATSTSAPTLPGDRMYPPELLNEDQRLGGGLILYAIGVLYMFVFLAIVCDEFFVPALEVMVDKYDISDDVAGATLMAAGGSAPELFTSLIGVFIADSPVGFGTIIGSAVFNVLFVIGMCALFSLELLELTWWPLARDCSFYTLDLVVLYVFFLDKRIEWWESLVMLLLYAAYVGFMKINVDAEKFVKGALGLPMPQEEEEEKEAAQEEAPSSVPTTPEPNEMVQSIIHRKEQGSADIERNSVSDVRAAASPRSSASINIHNAQEHHLFQAKKHMAVTTAQLLFRRTTGEGSRGKGRDRFQHAVMLERQVHNRLSETSKHLQQSKQEADQARPEPLHPSLCGKRQAFTAPEEEEARPSLTKAAFGDDQSKKAAEEGASVQIEGKAEEEEESGPLDLSFPEGPLMSQINFVLCAPILFSLAYSMPDVRDPSRQHLWYCGFFGSIAWIAFSSYWMVWWATVIGKDLSIPDEVMGYTFLAAGTSVPDLMSSVIVAKQGLGDMAVSSSIGSNIFDITFGLPMPWFIWSLTRSLKAYKVESDSLEFSLILLIFMLVFVVGCIAACGWKMSKGLGGMMFVLYGLFLTLVLLKSYSKLGALNDF